MFFQLEGNSHHWNQSNLIQTFGPDRCRPGPLTYLPTQPTRHGTKCHIGGLILSRKEKTNFKSEHLRTANWPSLAYIWTNHNHWCHWLESAEHMDPLRHRRPSSFLPYPHEGASLFFQLQLLSICRAPRANGFFHPPWASQVWSNMVLRDRAPRSSHCSSSCLSL